MRIPFAKYHALGNDFLVIEKKDIRVPHDLLPELAVTICDRRQGIGADGILLLSASDQSDAAIDVYNSDGGWAEKSGNGLRIAGVHIFRGNRKRNILFTIAGSVDLVKVLSGKEPDYSVLVDIGEPSFLAKDVPVKSDQPFMINAELDIDDLKFPVTCLSVGNPHTVLIVDKLDFDWKMLGAEIEEHKAFPKQTNVEFVKIVNRKKIKVADWERGAGATGSSGTGAAAAVCAGVMLGLLDRLCEVQFENGSLYIDWNKESNRIELTGPVVYVHSGEFTF
jgi:diaminopimelate epimerase